MAQTFISVLTAVALLITTTSAFTCPNTCLCYQTKDHQRAATCTDLEALHKSLLRQKSPELDELIIKDASISKINGQLDRLVNLKSLDLSGNNLKIIKKLPRNLLKLDVSGNSLTSIDARELPRKLVALNLANNHLEELPRGLSALKSLRSMKVANNSLGCSCATLHVRDWVTRNSIRTDEIACYVGYHDAVPWNKIKSSESCAKPIKTVDMDEMMQGDDPLGGDIFQGSGSDADYDDDEYDDVFMTISSESVPAVSTTPVSKSEEENYDSSGDGGDFNFIDPEHTSEDMDSAETTTLQESSEASLFSENSSAETTTPDDDTEEDGSGSGGGALILFPDDEDLPEPTTEETISSSKTFGDFSSLFNWFGGGSEDEEEDDEVPSSTTEQPEVLTSEAPIFSDLEPVVEPEIVKEQVPDQETAIIKDVSTTDAKKEEINVGNVQTPQEGDNSTTYACLGVLSLLLLVLVVYVIFKKRKTDKSRKRQQRRDAENPGTELRDLNKMLIEKANVKRNGSSAESAPLMSNGDKKNLSGPRIIPATVHNNGDAKPEPLISKPISLPLVQSQPKINGKSVEKPLDNQNAKHPQAADKKMEEVPQVHVQSTPANQKDQNEPPRSENNPTHPVNDCKVRIKLKENPDSVPKTPVLVTRTRSNAGDIILTPVSTNGVTPALR